MKATLQTPADPSRPLAPSGRKRVPPETRHLGGLSFFVEVTYPSGRRAAYIPFNVPQQAFRDGLQTGIEAARELFQRLAASDLDSRMLPYVLSDLLADVHAASRERSDKPSRRGAASGFMRVLHGALVNTARTCDMPRYCDDWRAKELKENAEWDAIAAAEKQDFVDRMTAARAVKRAGSALGSGQGASA